MDLTTKFFSFSGTHNDPAAVRRIRHWVYFKLEASDGARSATLSLRAIRSFFRILKPLRGQLIAVSPQSPDNTLSQQEKDELSFQVLSDTNGLVAPFYNILYDVPDYIQKIMKQAGMDLTEYNAMNRWVLPIPSTFMIDESGIIRSAYVNPDFMQRLDPEDILQELRKL